MASHCYYDVFFICREIHSVLLPFTSPVIYVRHLFCASDSLLYGLDESEPSSNSTHININEKASTFLSNHFLNSEYSRSFLESVRLVSDQQIDVKKYPHNQYYTNCKIA